MPLFAILYSYTGDAAALDEHRPAHRAFLQQLQDAGLMLARGPFVGGAPGALLITRADTADQVAAALDEDPFHREQLIVRREIREWNPVGEHPF